MIFNEPDKALLELTQALKLETEALQHELSKAGLFKPDFSDALMMIVAVKNLERLTQIRDELRYSNHAERMKSFPASLLNQKITTGLGPQQGE